LKKTLYFFFLGWMGLIAQDSFDPLILAQQLLNSFDTAQKEILCFPFDDPAKTRWHYLPHSSFTREGLPLSEMNDEQVKQTYALLESYLSESGYNQMEQIIGLENYLAAVEKNPVKRDPTKYYLAFYGSPQRDSIWAWSFEGHHISLNFTIGPKAISFAPAFWGSNPGVLLNGPEKGKIVLKHDHNLGLELVNALSSAQLAQALISSQTYGEILTSNQKEVVAFQNNGIAYGQLNTSQQKIVRKIIDHHLERMEKEVAKKAAQQLEQESWEAVTFSWAGKMKKLSAHYYRIQGKGFLIEYDNSQNEANHIHVVWREFDGDFGKDLIREHYLSGGH
jgi:hypothetical protein